MDRKDRKEGRDGMGMDMEWKEEGWGEGGLFDAAFLSRECQGERERIIQGV